MNTDRSPVWIKTDIISLCLQPSSPPRQRKCRKIPTSSATASTTNAYNHKRSIRSESFSAKKDNLAADWGWARGYILPNTSSPVKRIAKKNGYPHSNGYNISPSKNRAIDNSQRTDSLVIVIDDPESEHDGKTLTVSPPKAKDGVVRANSWISTPSGKPPEDLIHLTHLHEPAIIHSLRKRYCMDQIYTDTGPILLALNPFKQLTDLYTYNLLQEYRVRGEMKSKMMDFDKNLPPHVYAVADDAFRDMMRESQDGSKGDQSILVSGESGAGKTVTTKFIMKYLATLSNIGQDLGGKENKGIEQQVLQSNPILESFGNARTIRNDNSSRFGKFIEIQFKESGSLIGASINTYLLEKVRLISQSPGERNYHIFYEILAGLSDREKRKFCLCGKNMEDFRMTNLSDTWYRRDGVEDGDTYKDLRQAMHTMGFSLEEQSNTLNVTCALLHFSNLNCNEISGEKAQLDSSNPSLKPAVTLLGVTADVLDKALCTCTISAGGEVLVKNLSLDQASKAMEAFIKATYGALFSFIVQRINNSIGTKETGSSRHQRNRNKASIIGVLDIFGFESFAINSFEQLCINYCNEALQQQFNKFVFKLEQQEYEREGIEWSFISFPDNQDVLELIDKKHSGILSVLDEQCRLAKCTDQSFANALFDKCEGHSRFMVTKHQRACGKFSVCHYAGPVEYSSNSFLEKNKDELPKETTDLLMSSENKFFTLLADILISSQSAKTNSNGNSRSLKRTGGTLTQASVGSQFHQQLGQLRERIDQTCPHYVRCLKTNDDLIPDNFDPVVISDQLRCAGVLEAVRVSRVGFPQRYTHALFVQRYRILALKDLSKLPDYRRDTFCEVLVQVVAKQIWDMQGGSEAKTPVKSNKSLFALISVGVQMGRTKVFLRQEAFDFLECLRVEKMEIASCRIQSIARMFLCENRFKISLLAVLRLQSFFRQCKAMSKVAKLRQTRAAILLQRTWRKFHATTYFNAALMIAQFIQKFERGRTGRVNAMHSKRNRASIIIQCYWRRYVDHIRFRFVQLLALKFQSVVRSHQARKVLKSLKVRARDLESIAGERDDLRREAQQMRDELAKEKARREAEVEQASTRIESPVSEITTNNDMIALKSENARLRRELSLTQSSGMTYCDFPNSPSVQERELERLSEENRQQHQEIVALKREIGLLKFKNNQLDASGQQCSRESARSVSPLKIQPRRGLFSSPLGTLKGLLGVNPLNDDTPPKYNSSNLPMQQNSPQTLNRQNLENFETDTSSPLSFQSPALSTNAIETILDQQSTPASLLSSSFVSTSGDRTPLHHAVCASDQTALLEAFDKSHDLHTEMNTGDEQGRTPLHLASIQSAPKIVSFLLDQLAVANSQDHAGNTPLHYANDVSVMELLLQRGANPNIPNMEGLCALHLSIRRKDVQATKCLLSQGADVNVADNLRWHTPLHLVAKSETQGELMTEMPLESGSMKLTTTAGQIAKLLCEVTFPSKPDLNCQDREGNTPLHHAVYLSERGACELIWVFLNQGGDPNVRNRRGQTPLHLLCHNQPLRQFDFYQEVLHLLLFHGACPNMSSQTGCTPLHLALFHQDIDAAEQLIHHGAGLNIPWTKPLRWEAFWDETGSPEVLPVDMIVDEKSFRRLLSAIQRPQDWAPSRPFCMQCKVTFGPFVRQHHCRLCGRIVCGQCSPRRVHNSFFPSSFKALVLAKGQSSRVCIVCEETMHARKESSSLNSSNTRHRQILECNDVNDSYRNNDPRHMSGIVDKSVILSAQDSYTVSEISSW